MARVSLLNLYNLVNSHYHNRETHTIVVKTKEYRKHQKIGGGGGGGAVSRGTFGMKRAPEKILTEMLATGGREGKTIAIVQKYNLNNIFHEIK